jgi:MFS family permease
MSEAAPASPGLLRASATRFIVLLGLVSLCADMTYEGARSVTGPYLGMLGASAAIVGFIAGLGEFLGYALRLLSGYLTDRTGAYWPITFLGYGVNLVAVPLLALAGSWELAVLLIVAERAGKAIRAPARDAMLSHAGSQTGLGFAFGLHGALDQTGAILGPMIVSAALYWKGGYQTGFAILAIPALCAMLMLAAARHLYPRPRDLEVTLPDLTATHLPHRFFVYVAAAALIAAGYADFPLIAYHFGKTGMIAPFVIPLLYALAMAAEASSALFLGRLYDRNGMKVMMFATLASSLSAPLAFLGPPIVAALGMVLWGIGMGAQASVMRAAIAKLAPAFQRGSAYGIFNATYGLAWFAGSSLLGVLYDWSVAALAGVSVLLQGAALVLLWRLWRQESEAPAISRT